MRRSGTVEHTRGLGPHDHVCWSYDDQAEFTARAGEFLEEGLADGQKVCFVGSVDETLCEDLNGIGTWRHALGAGAAHVVPLGEVYPVAGVIEPEAQVQAYATATESAVAEGFTGYRVAAEATPLVRTAEQLDAFARYEHLIDAYMTERPFSALCAYRRPDLDADSIEQLACLHPTSNDDGVGFRLHASDREGFGAALGGELDLATQEAFDRALDRIELRPHDGDLVIDATELRFVDHRSLLMLSEKARHQDSTVVLRTSRPGIARLAELLDVSNLRVELAA